MYTIHQGLNGGWYGSVSTDDPDDMETMAKRLSTALSSLREACPKLPPPVKQPKPKTLNPAGQACLDYHTEHPNSTIGDLVAAGHKRSTITWLVKHGFMPAPSDPPQTKARKYDAPIAQPAAPPPERKKPTLELALDYIRSHPNGISYLDFYHATGIGLDAVQPLVKSGQVTWDSTACLFRASNL